jgi:hypothetical protein
MKLLSSILTASLVSGLMALSQSSYTINAQQSDPADSRNIFFTSPKEKIIKDYNFQPLDASNEIDRMIFEEMRSIDRVAGFSTPVWKTNTRTIAHPTAGIGINIKELGDYAQRANVRQFRQYLRFILAHEKTHQLQFLRYPTAFRQADAEQHRIYECQADILGGKYLIEAQGQPEEEDQQAIRDALQVAFVMGTEEFGTTVTHPSHEQRRTAVRLGMASGTITNFSKLPPAPEQGQIIGSIAEKLNIIPGEDVMGWSLRTAKRIIHYNRAASLDIALIESDVDWDESAGSPYVTYSYTYQNKGRKAIQVDMEMQCAWVLRTDPKDTFSWQKWSVKNYSFKLLPGQKYTAKGTLLWGSLGPNPASAFIDFTKLMPRLVAPIQDPNALISCDYID